MMHMICLLFVLLAMPAPGEAVPYISRPPSWGPDERIVCQRTGKVNLPAQRI